MDGGNKKKKCKLMIDLSKFISNKNAFCKIVVITYLQVKFYPYFNIAKGNFSFFFLMFFGESERITSSTASALDPQIR